MRRSFYLFWLALLGGCQPPTAATTPSTGAAATNTAGGAQQAEAQGSAQASGAELPVLRVGTSGDYAPFSHAGEGFDIDVAQRMARDLGYRVEFVPFSWPTLAEQVARDEFDIAMAGITWKPDRAVVGAMTRAIAAGGPCVLTSVGDGGGNPANPRVAVNRGGILERWARTRYADALITTVDDNLSLPQLLTRGEVGTIVTDRFEVAHFARPGWTQRCEPPRDRKVYWVAPARAAELAPKVDLWLAQHEADLRVLRGRWLGGESDWTDTQHLVDLLARRLSLMPAVGAYKRAHGLAIEDLERERVVLEQVLDGARSAGLDRASVRALFVEQMTLAKAVQRRSLDADPMDLDSVLRPALSRLGARILDALARSASDLPALQLGDLDLLVPLLEPAELARLLQALRAVRLAEARQLPIDGPDARAPTPRATISSRRRATGPTGAMCHAKSTRTRAPGAVTS